MGLGLCNALIFGYDFKRNSIHRSQRIPNNCLIHVNPSFCFQERLHIKRWAWSCERYHKYMHIYASNSLLSFSLLNWSVIVSPWPPCSQTCLNACLNEGRVQQQGRCDDRRCDLDVFGWLTGDFGSYWTTFSHEALFTGRCLPLFPDTIPYHYHAWVSGIPKRFTFLCSRAS